MAIIAAIKKVLSPSSDTIMEVYASVKIDNPLFLLRVSGVGLS